MSDEITAAELGWSQMRRREVQLRLNLAGYDVGKPDGSFGNRTRTGIRAWQTAAGQPATGSLSEAQYQMLVAQTQAAYAVVAERLKEQQALRRDARSAQRVPAGEPGPERLPPAEQGGGGVDGAAGAAFIGGVLGGVLGGALGR